MKLKTVLSLIILVALGVVRAAPISEENKEEAENASSFEVKTDLTSSLVADNEDDPTDAAAARSKKASEGPKTLCTNVVGADGKSYLQCAQEPEAAASFSIPAFSAASVNQENPLDMIARLSGNHANNGAQMAPGMSYASSASSSSSSSSQHQPMFRPGHTSATAQQNFYPISYNQPSKPSTYSYQMVPGMDYAQAPTTANNYAFDYNARSASEAQAEVEAAGFLAKQAMDDAREAAENARAAAEYQSAVAQYAAPAATHGYAPSIDWWAQGARASDQYYNAAAADGSSYYTAPSARFSTYDYGYDQSAGYRAAMSSPSATASFGGQEAAQAEASARVAYEQAQTQAMAAAYESARAASSSSFSSPSSAMYYRESPSTASMQGLGPFFAPGIHAPSPAPHVPCPTNLLLSCAPNVDKVPCVAQQHVPAPKPTPAVSYFAPRTAADFDATFYAAPQNFAPKQNYRAKDNEERNGKTLIVQPQWTADDKANEIDQSKADWS